MSTEAQERGGAASAASGTPEEGGGAGPQPTIASSVALHQAELTAMEETPWSHPSGATLTVVNCTATVELGCPLDLQDVVMRARNAEYNPKRFSACIVRLTDPKATALMFGNGSMVVTGTKSTLKASKAVAKFAKIVELLGNTVRLTNIKVQNMVATADVQFPIRLEGLVTSAHASFCSYEPELFPGLIYRYKDPKVCVLVFVSGKVVLTGGKSLRDLRRAFEGIYPVLHQFRQRSVLLGDTSAANNKRKRRRRS